MGHFYATTLPLGGSVLHVTISRRGFARQNAPVGPHPTSKRSLSRWRTRRRSDNDWIISSLGPFTAIMDATSTLGKGG